MIWIFRKSKSIEVFWPLVRCHWKVNQFKNIARRWVLCEKLLFFKTCYIKTNNILGLLFMFSVFACVVLCWQILVCTIYWYEMFLYYVYWFFQYFWEFLKEKIHFGWGNEKKRNRNNIQELFLGRGRSILDYCDFGRLKVCSPSLISLSDFYVQIDFWWKFGRWLRCDELGGDIKRNWMEDEWWKMMTELMKKKMSLTDYWVGGIWLCFAIVQRQWVIPVGTLNKFLVFYVFG